MEFHTKYPIHKLKDMILYNIEILRALRFKLIHVFEARPGLLQLCDGTC